MRMASSTGTALAVRMLKVRVKRAGIEAAHQPPEQRHPQLQAMEAPRGCPGFLSQYTKSDNGGNDGDRADRCRSCAGNR